MATSHHLNYFSSKKSKLWLFCWCNECNNEDLIGNFENLLEFIRFHSSTLLFWETYSMGSRLYLQWLNWRRIIEIIVSSISLYLQLFHSSDNITYILLVFIKHIWTILCKFNSNEKYIEIIKAINSQENKENLLIHRLNLC